MSKQRTIEQRDYQHRRTVNVGLPTAHKLILTKYRQNWRRILVRRLGQCHWCKHPLTDDRATLEHIVPISAGGKDDKHNLTIACADCNQVRGESTDPVEIKKLAQERRRERKERGE